MLILSGKKLNNRRQADGFFALTPALLQSRGFFGR